MSNWQIPDYLRYKEREFKLQPYLLRPYFQKYPERRLNRNQVRYFISNHHRLYIATFEIIDTDFEIVKFTIRKEEKKTESRLEEVFPNNRDKKLTWFNGILLLGIGGDSTYYSAYHGTYYLKEHEEYVVLEIKNGKLTKELSFNKKEFIQFKISQFELFKTTQLYKEEREKIIERFKKRQVIQPISSEFNEVQIDKILLHKMIFINKEILEQ